MSTREDPRKKAGLTPCLPSKSRSFGGVLGCHREPADAKKTQWVRFLVKVRILIGVRVRRTRLRLFGVVSLLSVGPRRAPRQVP